MRRATIHLFFATLASIFLLVVLWQAYHLHHNRTVIESVQNVPAILTESTTSTISGASYPAVMLSTASALSSGGQFEQAETMFVTLIDEHQSDAVGQAARYNLANHYLRQGMRTDLPGAQTRPLVELAKQRYRDLLLIDPQNWDAKYNLEVALHVAPELTTEDRDKIPPVKSVDVVVPDFTLQDLP